jgi:uncharacterized protein (TIGR03083 family)
MATRRTPALDHRTAMQLAETEYARFTAALKRLSPDDWQKATVCEGWDVRAMVTHSLGMADLVATPFETRRQMKEAKKRGGVFIDALTGLQVEERADLDPVHIVHQFEKAGPRAAKGRRRIPGILRSRQTLPAAETDGADPWSLGYLVDVILTRDAWMHRMDIAAAVGHEPELTPDHDGILVDDAVREWAVRHGQPCSVFLSGPAGGSWTFGTGGPTIELDAIDFCRTVTGRRAGQGLLETPVPF